MTEKPASYETRQSVSKEEVDDALAMLGTGYDPAPELPQGFASPNYTQAPNDFYDYYLKRIDSLAELKVIDTIIRHTFGYHRQRVRLGMREIAEYAGLSYNSVATGAAAAEARGLIRRMNPETKEKAEWELVVARPSKFEGSTPEGANPQNSRDVPSNSEGQVGVKESIKESQAAKKEAPTARAETPIEIRIFRGVTGKYPQKVNYPDVERAIRRVGERIGAPAQAGDLRKFYAAWCAKNYNPGALGWLEWAISGTIPQQGGGRVKVRADETDEQRAARIQGVISRLQNA